MDIEPILPEDGQLERFRKTGRNLGAHAWNGLRTIAVSRNPLAVAGIVAHTPTEEFAQDYGIGTDQVGRSLPQDMALRAAGAANRATLGVPGLAMRALRSVPAMLGSQLSAHLSAARNPETGVPVEPEEPPQAGIPGVSGASIRQDPATVEENRRDRENYQSSAGGVRG